jgi:hypothetical protein
MGSLISTMIRYGFYSTVLVVGGILCFARATLPENSSFSLADGTVVGKVTGALAKRAFTFKDFWFFKLAILDQKMAYIGIFQTWVPLR